VAIGLISQKDVTLLASLSFLTYDLACKWEDFGSCPKPIHKWLVVSYVLIMVWRLAIMAASLLSSVETAMVMFNLRHKSSGSRTMVSLIWMASPPLMAAWTALGSVWGFETVWYAPDCMPSALHTFFLAAWQVLSYVWLGVNLFVGSTVWSMEKRVLQAEQDLQELQDDDVVSRWGNVAQLDSYTSLPATMAGGGLTPADIRSLPGVNCRLPEDAQVSADCPICLNLLQAGETVRVLPACCHEFHRPCIDLWLLRSADCPICKTKVAAST